ncbi:MAG: helix-turn-helix transcriptional regulator [Bacteroidales bacterium]|jgi:DNA-binding XRE family transcriptional regulator|nr:helix-turn-helix transcriptional regulator [Bacteroidales bacterium]
MKDLNNQKATGENVETGASAKTSGRRRYVPGKSDNRGERLKPYREELLERNMTVTEFANRLGVSRQTINFRWNSDDCSLSDAEKMAEVLDCKFVWKLEPIVKDFGE